MTTTAHHSTAQGPTEMRTHAVRGADDVRLVTLDPRGSGLQHEKIRISVHDEARKAIGLRVHASSRPSFWPSRECAGEPAFPEAAVDCLGAIEGQDSHPDLRPQAHHPAGQKLTRRARHVRDAAVLDQLADGLDGSREDPGVPLAHRLLAPRLEDDGRMFEIFHRVWTNEKFTRPPRPERQLALGLAE